MTEILTESFCERCGTRYTFESARPRVRLKGVKTMSRGLKNFVLSDDTSMDEAMAAARAETEREVHVVPARCLPTRPSTSACVPAVHLPELLERAEALSIWSPHRECDLESDGISASGRPG
jgi:hypothetical protein